MNIALVLSGGTGTRLGGDIPKQYIEVNGQMLISFCLKMFSGHKRVDGIWIVASKEWQPKITEEAKKFGFEKDIFGFSLPGENRQLSIYNGLVGIRDFLGTDSEEKTVIVHDAARPNLSASFTNRCLDALEGYDGVMPVLPMKDTVYYSEDKKSVDRLLEREKIYAGQAPEVYRLDKYIEANERLLPKEILNIKGSTEPAVMAGLKIAMIPGDEKNYKVTTKNDLDKFRLEQDNEVYIGSNVKRC